MPLTSAPVGRPPLAFLRMSSTARISTSAPAAAPPMCCPRHRATGYPRPRARYGESRASLITRFPVARLAHRSQTAARRTAIPGSPTPDPDFFAHSGPPRRRWTTSRGTYNCTRYTVCSANLYRLRGLYAALLSFRTKHTHGHGTWYRANSGQANVRPPSSAVPHAAQWRRPRHALRHQHAARLCGVA